MQEIGRKYTYCGFGGNFRHWIMSNDPQPYGRFGNGSAMRISPVAFAAETMEECIKLADAVTSVTHDLLGRDKGRKSCCYCYMDGSTWM